MKICLKRAFLYVSKWLGLFHLARRLTRHALRIIGYHGFSITDEGLFRRRLFMNPEAFAERMQFLSDKKIPVLELSRALECLDSGTLPACSTVITIDDGFYSVFKCAYPVLREFSFPSTVYVSTYYCINQNPIFRLAVQYMFWKTQKDRVDLSGLGIEPYREVSLADGKQKETIMWDIIRHGESRCSEEQRSVIGRAIGDLLAIDYEMIVKNRGVGLLTREETLELERDGVNVELHTHRHRFPVDEPLARKEIVDNREILEDWIRRPLKHLCYPDGLWDKRQFPWLEALGVESALTCGGGLNYKDTPRFALRRMLDSEIRSSIEFEAELSGYIELLRIARSYFRRRLG